MLTIFTVSMSLMIAGLTFYLTPGSVMVAVGVLALILTSMWAVMLFIPNKAKAFMGLLISFFVMYLVLLVIMIPLCIAGYFEALWILYCCLGVLGCSIAIYIDIFIIMLAGKHAMDEYILCAIMLYVDIVRMLLYLLMIFGKAK
jgi:FtsH-binding integral membrane protein